MSDIVNVFHTISVHVLTLNNDAFLCPAYKLSIPKLVRLKTVGSSNERCDHREVTAAISTKMNYCPSLLSVQLIELIRTCFSFLGRIDRYRCMVGDYCFRFQCSAERVRSGQQYLISCHRQVIVRPANSFSVIAPSPVYRVSRYTNLMDPVYRIMCFCEYTGRDEFAFKMNYNAIRRIGISMTSFKVLC